MLNMQFSMFAYIFWAQLLATYYILLTNCIPNLVFIYLFCLYHRLPPLHHVKCFYIAMRENEIQRVAFMFWVHLLTCTYTVGLYIFINYTEFGLFISQFFIAVTNITVCLKQTENTVRT